MSKHQEEKLALTSFYNASQDIWLDNFAYPQELKNA